MQAVILAAGQGVRLLPLTEDRPKCLVEVQGKPILQRQIEALSDAGIRECTIVIGYRGAQVRALCGDRFRELSISYVENERFEGTNNLYSLWLACRGITDDALLLEGDLVFDPRLLVDLLKMPRENVALVDPFRPSMDGTVIRASGDLAREMVLKQDQSPSFDFDGALKTVNIYKFSHRSISQVLLPAFDDYVSQGLTDQYYELAISRAVAESTLQLHVLRTGAWVWAEIDTENDLREAETILGLAAPGRNRPGYNLGPALGRRAP